MAKKDKNKALDQVEEQILWKGKKCILGLPISFTTYIVEEDRLISKVGVFSSNINEILLYRILDLRVKRTFGQKIFGVGTVTLFTADKTDSTLELKNIKQPQKVWRFLSNLVEAKRDERRLIGREMYGVAGDGVDGPDMDGDGIPDILE